MGALDGTRSRPRRSATLIVPAVMVILIAMAVGLSSASIDGDVHREVDQNLALAIQHGTLKLLTGLSLLAGAAAAGLAVVRGAWDGRTAVSLEITFGVYGVYLAIHYTERLAEAGVVNSVGSRGDSYDKALAETVNGLYKAELINRRGPWRSVEQVELETSAWVHWS